MSADEIAAEKAANIPPEHGGTYERDRYIEFRSQALDLADTLNDEFAISTAIFYLIEVCMKAGDVQDARALFRHVTVDIIQEKILAAYPQLAHARLSDLVQNSRH